MTGPGGQSENLCMLSGGLWVWVERGQKGKGGAGLSKVMRLRLKVQQV